ncbi:MAG TPA: FAD-dependent oxidoreductase, partial [Dehalococcoidia bacterium]|nr:FAD-dependent oxidoreductase [Dehalococcoidia bacterium]
MAALPEAADLVVVGGGIVGASVAYFARKAGIERVALIERGLFG